MKLSELEVKIGLNKQEFERVFEACRKHYGEPHSHITQLDEYYDTVDGQISSQDLVLRVRSINDVQLVALKSPRVNLPSGLSNRIELEFTVAEGNVKAQLESQGLSPFQVSEKERWTFVFGETEILLDRLPFIGTFIEVEGPNEAAIEEVLNTLQIASLARIQKNYGELMREKMNELNLSHKKATFKIEKDYLS